MPEAIIEIIDGTSTDWAVWCQDGVVQVRASCAKAVLAAQLRFVADSFDPPAPTVSDETKDGNDD